MTNTDTTIAAYDKFYDVYDKEVVEFWNQFPASTTEAFVGQLPGKRVLDLGSGSGRDAVLLRDKGLEVVCLDASAKMVEMTKKLGFESHYAEFTDMQFPDHSFDGVWAYTSLIHIPPNEAATAIQKLRDFIRPNGVLLIGVIVGEQAGMVQRKSMPGVERYFKQYKQDELTKMVSGLGFRLEYQEEYQPHTTIYLSQIYTR